LLQSASDEQPSAILIIAPVGAYWKRVLSGIKMVIGKHCQRGKTELHIFLVIDSKWDDPKYTEECVQPLKKEYSEDPWVSEFPKYKCETVTLDVENENDNTAWLLEKLLSFLKKGPKRKAFIDLTSAPREWLFSSFYVSNFFSNVEFYFVKSKRKKSPSEYSDEAKTDEGLPPDYVLKGELKPPLSWWLEPRGRKRRRKPEENVQYKVFRLMCEIASEKKAKLSELPELTIDEEELAKRAKAQIPYYKKYDVEGVLRSISRHLTDVDRFELFRRVGKRGIAVNRRAIALMQVLFR